MALAFQLDSAENQPVWKNKGVRRRKEERIRRRKEKRVLSVTLYEGSRNSSFKLISLFSLSYLYNSHYFLLIINKRISKCWTEFDLSRLALFFVLDLVNSILYFFSQCFFPLYGVKLDTNKNLSPF